ncbi:MAG: Periplasmic chaperone and peptidyl-prolyl cis-trans isomerase of outer membrane proteins SurA [uncultured Sphingomonas sp.]|uniref:Parvulin-like PPIase n=1 Tax=uncultured Sphingomonas sp. TaxID=158754 RepID=A0A6J4T9R0_9SPHN|nr:peptidylprolyl isomerase [uncultured Sphingomonas sp.]CAA9517174.1 MAG: Periplasmic chaperone and peptidyl-prolyl cis-trans isomerase of outer membrane proteins SurA [uncultured Sphingomonas sp.]
MAARSKLLSGKARFALAAAAITAGTVAAAQTAPRTSAPQTGATARNSVSALRLPENPQLFGAGIPSVVKASAIVNGEVITQTDIDQRLALLAISQGSPIPAEELERLRVQVLRNLIDETLQIQAAKAAEIDVTAADIDKTVARVAGNVKQTPEQMGAYLKANGSSLRSIRRQIEGEIAWQRLQRAKIESQISVGDEEVKAVIDRMNADKGTQEYRVGEIFLAASPANQQEVLANAGKIIAALQGGGSFVGYARQFSEASTAAVGGDLGWVRPQQLPEQLAAVVAQMGPGQLSQPIKVPGGYSIIAVQDTRKVLTADPRNAELSLKQVSINFPKGTSRAQAEPILARFASAAQNVGGCGGADKLAADFRGEVVSSDQVKLRELPPALQQMMVPMQVGQATRPFGSLDEGVRVLVICGRDEGNDASAPSEDQVFAQLTEERVNMRARRYLRDLRRDAIIDFR